MNDRVSFEYWHRQKIYGKWSLLPYGHGTGTAKSVIGAKQKAIKACQSPLRNRNWRHDFGSVYEKSNDCERFILQVKPI